MKKLIIDKISQIEKERQYMSDSHHKNYQKTRDKINEYEKIFINQMFKNM